MKRISIITLLLLLLSCGKDTETQSTTIDGEYHGTLILNNGNWGGNDSNISIVNIEDGSVIPDAFYRANGLRLGDLGQDIICVGECIYIAVNGSQAIFITDKELKIIKRIDTEINGTRLSPRAFTTDGKMVYVSFYEGFVGRIMPETFETSFVEVGANPDGIDVCNGRLYTADSGGMAYPDYNNTVSVISLDTFKCVDKITVNLNPVKIAAYADKVYILSYGDYAANPPMIQVYDTENGTLEALGYEFVSSMARGEDGLLYILCAGYDEDWSQLPGKVMVHDMKNNIAVGEFIKDSTILDNAYSISAASDGNIYVGCSDYKTSGDVYIFDTSGTLLHKIDSHGFNPIIVETI